MIIKRPSASTAILHHLLLIVFAVDLFGSPLLAQYGYQAWTTAEGLPQNEVRGITQTPDGYLWIATMDGLARFDGLRFTHFNRGNTEAIRSNRFARLEQGRNGELWLVTEGGDVLKYSAGTFQSFGANDGIPPHSATLVTADSRGGVWVLTDGRIRRWNAVTNRFELSNELNTRRYSAFAWDVNGFGSFDANYVYCFTKGLLYRHLLAARLRGHGYSCYALDEDSHAWIGKESRGKWIGITKGSQADSSLLPDNFLMTYANAEGKFWKIRPSSQLYRTLRFVSNGAPMSITFRHAFVDLQGNLWLGTEGRGLYRLQEQPVRMLSVEQGLIDRDVYPIYQDRTGSVWIGAWHTGLSRFHNGRFTNYSVADGLPNELVTALTEDNRGTLWIGTHGGLTTYHNGHFDRGGVPRLSEPIQAIHQDRGGTYWFGMRAGLAEWKNGSLRILTPADGLASYDVHTIAETIDGDLWFGGTDGLTQLHEGHFIRWTDRNELTRNNVWSLYAEADGTLWIGTFDAGLLRLKGDRLTRYRSRDGLFNDGVFQILDDNLGHLWISCDLGIYRLNKQELVEFADGNRDSISSAAFGKSDGMRVTDANGGVMPAGTSTSDGRLWFPTQDGIAVIDPTSLLKVSAPLRPVLESALVDREPASLGSEILLTPDRNQLEIRYTAPDFSKPEQVRFRYRLDGLDPHWIQTGLARSVVFAHLPPGKYRFEVSATNQNGVWSAPTPGLPITVVGPFYKAPWFIAFLLAVAALPIYFLWRYRLSQIRQQQALQTGFMQELISSQEDERMRIASELHDSLGQRLVIIHTMAQLSLREDETKNLKHSFSEISSEALAAIDDTRAIAHDLRPVHLEQLGLTASIGELVAKFSNVTNLEVSAEVENIDDILPAHLEINIYRIVQEALSNIAKYACATNASIHITRTAEKVSLTVSDNGIGFHTEGNINKEGRRGMGLRGMAERATLIGAIYTVSAAPGEGTQVKVVLELTGRLD